MPDLATVTLAKGEHLGFEWQIVHNHYGYRCGYVRVLRGHPWFEQGYDDVDVSVHGGLTFAEHGKTCESHEGNEEWWLGFDCAHAGDAADPELYADARPPYRVSWEPGGYEVIRSTEYVRDSCLALCESAATRLERLHP